MNVCDVRLEMLMSDVSIMVRLSAISGEGLVCPPLAWHGNLLFDMPLPHATLATCHGAAAIAESSVSLGLMLAASDACMHLMLLFYLLELHNFIR